MSMENNINIVQNKCTACRACEQICPKNAITMIEDEEGFLYPKIDNNLCINCGLCIKKCHTLEKYQSNYKKIYGVKPIDTKCAKNSTSGGIAYILSKSIIDSNGVVYGAIYDNEFNVKHVCVDNLEELQKLRGSKYVASDTQFTFSDVKEKLQNGINVLYIGTACQIAGLNKFLNEKYDNLLTVDIVCHGVPSNKLFKKYIDYLEKKYHRKLVSYEFRNKDKKNWGNGYCAKAVFEKKEKKYINADFDYYYYNFLKGSIFRECCYECRYANINNRSADITIADCWGIEKSHPKFYDKNGVSLLIINNSHAEKYFKNIRKKVNCVELEEKMVVKYNLNLLTQTKRPEIRNNIYKNIDIFESREFFEKNFKKNINMKSIIKSLLPNNLRMILKKMIGE